MAKEKINRDIKAEDIYCLLANKYSDNRQYACAREVQEKTGWAQRRLDFVAVDCFESNNLEIMAFEVKISKSDFRRELEDPTKHNIFFDDIDKYSIVAPDYVLDDMSIIPPKWGVYHVIRNVEGNLELKTVRKPLALHDEQQRLRPVGRKFFASLFRAANTQSHIRSVIYKERDELEEKIKQELEVKLTNGGRIVTEYDVNELNRLRDACRKLGIHLGYSGMSEYDAKHFREAKDVADHLHYLRSSLNSALINFKSVFKQVDNLLESIKKNGGNPSEALGSMAKKLTSEDVAEKVSTGEAEAIWKMLG